MISVVMACRNEASGIVGCVESLLAQRPVAGGFELIVVDGMSTDGTRELLRRMAQVDRRLRVVDNPESVTPVAFNVGIQAARGQYVAIVGAHSRYAHDYLAKCLEVALETGADNVGGGSQVESDGLVGRAIELAHHSRLSVGGSRWHERGYEGYADSVFGGFYKRGTFDRVGWFDPTLVRNQDDEFNFRLLKSGGTVYCSAKIRSWYSPRRRFSELFAQYAQYGYWRIAVIRKHGRPSSIRQVIPAACSIAFLLILLCAVVWSWTLLIAAGAVCMYLAAMLGGSWNLTRKAVVDKPIGLPRRDLGAAVVVVLLCLHIGYGLGSLVGILDACIGRHGRRSYFRRITRH